MPAPENDRLVRIETKIDQLSEAFVSLARTEERMFAMERDREEIMKRLISLETRQELRLTKLEDKLSEVGSKLTETTGTTMVINKLFWLVVAAVAGAVALQFFG